MSNCLKDYAYYVTDKTPLSRLTNETYVSIDNMLPNKGGIIKSECVPKDGNATMFNKGDILIGNIRPYFKKIWLATFSGGCSPDVLCIRSNSKVSSEFLYAVLSQDSFFDYDMAGSKGSKMPRGDKEHIMNFPIVNLKNKNKIGEFITTISNKISVNNDISSQLESLAKTIYDYWFLQFDFPDENGNPYRSSGGKMVWNDELEREIPEGWEVKCVKNCIQHINTGLNPRKNFILGNGNIKYITVKNLTTKGTIDWTSCETVDNEAREIIHKRSDVSKGDILFASIAPLGRCVLVEEDPKKWDINESVFSIRPNYDRISSEYLYMYFMSEYFIKKADHTSTGSVFSGIRISALENMLIITPPINIVIKFTKLIKTVLYKKYNNEKENQELASLRDFLLPMLMNGQVIIE